MHYLCTFGLKNEPRQDVDKHVALIKYGSKNVENQKEKGNVNVRMISGDHLETCKYIAIKAGIVTKEEADKEAVILSGDAFRNKIGTENYTIDKAKGKVEWKVKKPFINVKKRLKVIARATDEDKLLLVEGIKEEGGLILMSGDSINEARALRAANVGIAMGSGCQVAKDNSDLVILDNNFKSIYRAIMWGR